MDSCYSLFFFFFLPHFTTVFVCSFSFLRICAFAPSVNRFRSKYHVKKLEINLCRTLFSHTDRGGTVKDALRSLGEANSNHSLTGYALKKKLIKQTLFMLVTEQTN